MPHQFFHPPDSIMMKHVSFLFLCLLLSTLAQAQTHQPIQISYLGNMGVQITGAEATVLIDGLHSFYKEAYLPPPKALIEQLISNEPIVDPPIQVVLATHVHGDHFDPMLVERFLEKHPKAVFMGSEQADTALLGENKKLKRQIHAVDISNQAPTILSHQGLEISAIYMNHCYASKHHEMENIGFELLIDGQRILHVGDTEWFEDLFEELGLEEKGIDVAILPYWMLMSAKDVARLSKWIRPKQLMATHIPPTGYEEIVAEIQKHFPKATCFTESGQTVVLK